MAEVKLFKKLAKYVDKKDGKEKTATNFYIQCGDQNIPVEVKYYEDPETHTDPNYRARKTVLSAFADLFPERDKDGKQDKAAESKTVENNDIPF